MDTSAWYTRKKSNNGLSIRTRTKVIRRKHIIQPTGFGAYSSTCCLWEGEDVPAPWEWVNSHPPVPVQKQWYFLVVGHCSWILWLQNTAFDIWPFDTCKAVLYRTAICWIHDDRTCGSVNHWLVCTPEITFVVRSRRIDHNHGLGLCF